jgi:predicted DCC family thiol-disulfide oxidoreductase YuxK
MILAPMDQSLVPPVPPRATVWFDGGCPLCAREIALMKRLDRHKRLSFIDLATAIECPRNRDEMLQRLHVQTASGEIYSGAEAFAVMWRAIPSLRALGVLGRQRQMLWLLERLYLAFLRFRPALQSLARRLGAGAAS